jgi:hypothetical protein
VHGLPVQEAGLYIGMSAGVGAVAGNVGGALISGHLGKRSLKSVLSFIAILVAVAAPLGIAMTLTPSVVVAIALMPIVGGCMTGQFGPALGVVLTLAKVRMRGATGALFHITGTLVGFGVGPLITGVISYVMGGGVSIRYGLAVLLFLDAWAGLHYWLARRNVEAEVEAHAGEAYRPLEAS